MTVTMNAKLSELQAFLADMGESIAMSGMFGCESIHQGKVIAWSCWTKNRDPLSLVEHYHLISGKLSKRADAMLADFRLRGGRHQILERTPDRCCVRLISRDGDAEDFSITWAQAEAEPWTKNKQGKLHANYSTPRKRMQMLWARVASDAVRAFAPECTAGIYDTNEMQDELGQEIAEDASLVEVPRQQAEALQPKPKSEPTATKMHIVKQSIFDANPQISASDSDPADAATVEQLKQSIKELSQVAGYEDIAARVRDKLNKSGLAKLAELSYLEATDLLHAIGRKQLDAFFAASLAGANQRGKLE